MILPLEGITVLDFTQLLSGPCASLRMADLGARVIKIEHYETGDMSRNLYGESVDVCDTSAFFQAINRNKESIALNLKLESTKKAILQLVKEVDVVLSNFKPGAMEHLGFGFATLKAINPSIVYGYITGYGSHSPWANKPGQDLLIQAISGLTYQTGNEDYGSVPTGIAVADIIAGSQLVQAVIAALYSGEATEVEVSMLEAILDLQFEPMTLFFQDGEIVKRGNVSGAHPLVAAPYGIYKTQDGYITLAMGSIIKLGELLDCNDLVAYQDSSQWYSKRDEIKQVLTDLLKTNTTKHWLSILEPADIWCAEVFNWEQLIKQPGFEVLNMLQTVQCGNGGTYQTTRCPIRIDGEIITNKVGAPILGQHTESIAKEFNLTFGA